MAAGWADGNHPNTWYQKESYTAAKLVYGGVSNAQYYRKFHFKTAHMRSMGNIYVNNGSGFVPYSGTAIYYGRQNSSGGTTWTNIATSNSLYYFEDG